MAEMNGRLIPGDEQRDIDMNRQEEHDSIPALSSFAPAIFVPATFDLTKKPSQQPANSNERLEANLTNFDRHTAQVRENIISMVTREANRISSNARKEEQALADQDRLPPVRQQPFAGLLEEDQFFDDLSAEPDKSVGSNDVPYTFSHKDVKPQPTDPGMTPRESAKLHTLNLIRWGVDELEGYAKHANTTKAKRVVAAGKDPKTYLARLDASRRQDQRDRMDTS